MCLSDKCNDSHIFSKPNSKLIEKVNKTTKLSSKKAKPQRDYTINLVLGLDYYWIDIDFDTTYE